MDNINNVFFQLSDDMEQQFFACIDYFCDKKGITSDEFQKNMHIYEHDFLSIWNLHCVLLDGDDEAYGRLVCFEQDQNANNGISHK